MLTSLLITSTLANTALAACNLTFLKNLTSSLVAVQTNGSYSDLAALSSNTTYTEQFKPASIRTGVLSKPLKIDHNRSFHDPVLCTTFTEVIVTDPSHPYVIGTRMEADGGNITKVESLVTDEGDW